MKISNKYIIIEGPIGVGKSSLARKLANSFRYELLMEQPKLNPFLERFYSHPDKFRLPTQLSFLFQRADQLRQLSARGPHSEGVVSDFMFQKDKLFAQLNLDEDELQLYLQTFSALDFQAPKPDLLIYLQAPVDVLVKRINKRKVKYELGMDKKYLEKLSMAYTRYFHSYDAAPLLIVNAAQINPLDNEEHYDALLAHLTQIKAGKHFFNPLAESL